MSNQSLGSRLKEFEGLIAAADVCRRKSRLKQNAGRQVASLPHLTVGGNLSITGDFFQPSTKIIHRNVHGSRDVAGSKFLRSANVQHKHLLDGRSRQYRLDIDL